MGSPSPQPLARRPEDVRWLRDLRPFVGFLFSAANCLRSHGVTAGGCGVQCRGGAWTMPLRDLLRSSIFSRSFLFTLVAVFSPRTTRERLTSKHGGLAGDAPV